MCELSVRTVVDNLTNSNLIGQSFLRCWGFFLCNKAMAPFFFFFYKFSVVFLFKGISLFPASVKSLIGLFNLISLSIPARISVIPALNSF